MSGPGSMRTPFLEQSDLFVSGEGDTTPTGFPR